MIEILIVDDNAKKIKDLRNLVEGIPEITTYDIASDVVTANAYLQKKHYDLLVLDINIPQRLGDTPLPQNGLDFLRSLNKSLRLTKPANIIGLTEFDENLVKFQVDFQKSLWLLIKYDLANNDWEVQIKEKINYLIQSKRDLLNSPQVAFQYDLAIITALRHTEFESVLNLDGHWELKKLANDTSDYYTGTFKSGDRIVKVIASFAPQMGMVASSVLTMKIISSFRPKYVAMCGISAGIKGGSNFGDILIADLSFDSGSGKVKKSTEGKDTFEPDYKVLALSTDLRDEFLSCQGNREYLDEIKRKWPSDKPQTDLGIHIGPLATGAHVVQNLDIVDDIQGHARKLIGLDMETYAVFYAANNCTKPRPKGVFSVKSVCDFADSTKNDTYQKYAAYTSANFLYHFALNKLNFE